MDDLGRPNRIHWYKAEPGALIYPHKHVFSPRIDNLDDDPTGLYELTGKPCPQRKYSQGTNEWEAPGVHVDGDYEDFMGRSRRAKYFGAGTSPGHPCGLAQAYPQGLIFGSTERNMKGHWPPYGVEFASTLPVELHNQGIELASTLPVELHAQAVELASLGRDAGARSRHAVEFAQVLRVMGTDAGRIGNGLELFGRAKKTKFEGLPLKNAIELAAILRTPPVAIARHPQGIELAAKTTHAAQRHGNGIEFRTMPTLPNLRCGMEFADVFRSVSPALTRYSEGIEFAFALRTPTPLVPGDSCSSAGELTWNTSYTGTISSGSSQWFKVLPPPSGTVYCYITVDPSLNLDFQSYESWTGCPPTQAVLATFEDVVYDMNRSFFDSVMLMEVIPTYGGGTFTIKFGTAP